MRTLILTFLTAALLALPGTATNYYVSSTRAGRSDSNAGTSQTAPWATLSKVLSKINSLQPGDTIYLERGSVFNVNTSEGADSSNYLKIQAGGTASNPVTLTGTGYGSGAMPIIRRTGGSGADTFILIRDSNFTIRDIELDGNMAAGYATTGIVIWTDGSWDGDNGRVQNVKILNMYIHNLGGTTSGATRYICGIVMNSINNYPISNCLIEGNRISDYSAHGLNDYAGDFSKNIWRNNIVINSYPYRDETVNSAIQVGSGTDNIFEHNYLQDTTLTSDGAAIRIAGKGNDSGLNTIRFNVVSKSGHHGIWFVQSNERGPWRMLYDIYGNIIYDSAYAGIMAQPGGDWKTSTINIYNNTLYNNWKSGGSSTVGDVTLDSGFNDTTFNLKNNLIHRTDTGNAVCLAVNDSFSSGAFNHRNNLYFREGATSKTAIYRQGTSYSTANVTSYESPALNSNPLFVNTGNKPTAANYTSGATPNGLSIQPASPAAGGGVNLGSSYALDINRTPRTLPWSIGAYQVSSSGGDTKAPAVSITTSSGSTVPSGSSITLSATASDDTGVTGVQFLLNGVNLLPEDTTSPYAVVWDTTGVASGSHSITAVARDAADNTATASTITVNIETVPIASDYYVSSIHPARSDTNAGTNPNAPWATLDKAVALWPNLSAGGTIHLERGSAWNLSFSDNYASLINGGDASAGPITLRGDDYGTGNKPRLRRTGGTADCAFFSIQGSYITLRDLELDGGHTSYGKNTLGVIISSPTTDQSHVDVLNMKLHNLGGSSANYICGIWLTSGGSGTVSDCLIEGNEVSDYSALGLNHFSANPTRDIIWRNNVVRNSYTGGRYPYANAALQIGSGGSNCLYEHNWLEDTTTTEGGISSFGFSTGDTGANTIRFNVIANSSSHGIFFADYISNKKMLYDLYGNIIYNCARAGIAIYPVNTYAAGTLFRIYNNTFFNNCTGGGDATRGDLELDAQCANTTVDVANNLIQHRTYGTSVGLAVDSGFSGTLTHRNNLYWHESGTSKNIIFHNQTYTVSNAKTYEPTAQNTDPKFNNTAQLPTATSLSGGATPDGLSIQSASPAIGAGADLGSAYALDINRTPRTDAWTIGAYHVGMDSSPIPIPAAPSGLRIVP